MIKQEQQAAQWDTNWKIVQVMVQRHTARSFKASMVGIKLNFLKSLGITQIPSKWQNLNWRPPDRQIGDLAMSKNRQKISMPQMA